VKLKRGSFFATFFLACVAALELEKVVLEQLEQRGRFRGRDRSAHAMKAVEAMATEAAATNSQKRERMLSLELASHLFDWSSIALAIGACIVFVATAAIVWLGIVKEHHWEVLREHANEKIAAVGLEAAKANAELGVAQADIAKAHAAIAEANARALEAKAETAKATEAAALANERAAELAIALKQRENRKIAPEQRTAILDRLKPLPGKGKILINALMGDAEAFQFSDQILSVLKEAGYAAEEVPQAARLMSINRTGLFLWMKDARNPPERAKNIATAFRLVGIEMFGDSDADITDPDIVVLVVSSHP
jgi:hypothetical protein